MYYNAFTYDANGNIETQKRYTVNSTGQNVLEDDLVYRYDEGSQGRKRNRLYHVDDAVADNVFDSDIDDMGNFVAGDVNVASNYIYDKEGRLIKDKQENIAKIEWRVDEERVQLVKTMCSFFEASHKVGKSNLPKNRKFRNKFGKYRFFS